MTGHEYFESQGEWDYHTGPGWRDGPTAADADICPECGPKCRGNECTGCGFCARMCRVIWDRDGFGCCLDCTHGRRSAIREANDGEWHRHRNHDGRYDPACAECAAMHDRCTAIVRAATPRPQETP